MEFKRLFLVIAFLATMFFQPVYATALDFNEFTEKARAERILADEKRDFLDKASDYAKDLKENIITKAEHLKRKFLNGLKRMRKNF